MDSIAAYLTRVAPAAAAAVGTLRRRRSLGTVAVAVAGGTATPADSPAVSPIGLKGGRMLLSDPEPAESLFSLPVQPGRAVFAADI
jgi:hypothetical protein